LVNAYQVGGSGRAERGRPGRTRGSKEGRTKETPYNAWLTTADRNRKGLVKGTGKPIRHARGGGADRP